MSPRLLKSPSAIFLKILLIIFPDLVFGRHQGVVLDAEALDVPLLDDLPRWDGQGLPPVWLALDEIVDPQNLGAMLRSAHFLGVDGVICCAKNSAPLLCYCWH